MTPRLKSEKPLTIEHKVAVLDILNHQPQTGTQIAACLLAVSYASEHTAGAGVPIAASQSIHFAMTEARIGDRHPALRFRISPIHVHTEQQMVIVPLLCGWAIYLIFLHCT